MLLERLLRARAKIHQVMAQHRTIAEFIVGENSRLDGKTVASVSWPEECLLVQVRRGETELLPTGPLTLQAGDFVYALTDEADMAALEELAQEKIGE
jgi:Trk K+ transport system NAD-binding subunit